MDEAEADVLAYFGGVKIIGATAHYVNDNLDEGPIIMQDVIHVDHIYTAEDMMHAGRDVEKNALCAELCTLLGAGAVGICSQQPHHHSVVGCCCFI
ncbi:formyl transferase family protein [Candidatus Erwinia dacicola]|nr:formyl transferase family protein [Candidatus Erwinia dacicola]